MNTPKFKVITNSTKKDNIPNIYKYNNVIHKKSKVINNIKARKQLYNWHLLDFPVFTYKKLTDTLRIQLNNIYLILEHINNLQANINEIQQKIHTAGLSINLFINNSFNITKIFDYQQQFVIIRNNKLEIHNNVELDTALVQNEIQFLHLEDYELFQLIPTDQNAVNITNKQIQLFNELSNKYNEYIEYENILNTDYDSAFMVYEHLLEALQDELPNIPIINLTTKDENEIFDSEIHDLISLNKNSFIEIFYVNKQNQNILTEFLMEKK